MNDSKKYRVVTSDGSEQPPSYASKLMTQAKALKKCAQLKRKNHNERKRDPSIPVLYFWPECEKRVGLEAQE